MQEAEWIAMTVGGFLLVLGLLLVFFCLQYRWDRGRIEADLARRGLRLTGVSIAVFATSSFMGVRERTYKASCVGEDGRQRSALCCTSMLTGVSWAEEEPDLDTLKLQASDTAEEAVEKIELAQEVKYRRAAPLE